MTTKTTKPSDWRRMVRSAIMLTALLFAALPAEAQQYVFLYKPASGTPYFLRNNNGTIQAQSSFGAYSSSCIFTMESDNTGIYFSNNSYYLRAQSSGTISTTSLNLNTSTSYRYWQSGQTNGRVKRYNQNYYLRYDSGWKLGNTTNPGTGAGYTVLFAYSEHGGTLTVPSITGADVLMATGTSNYGVAARTTVPYHQFDGYSGTTATSYYWYSDALQTAPPSETDVTSGTWNLVGGSTYASVNSSGQITVSSLPTNDIQMTLTCSVTSNGITKTASKTIVLQSATVATPTITRTGNDINLATSSVGATIYYTTDGTTPSSSSTAYTGSFSIENLSYPVTVKAIAIRNGSSSTIATETFSHPKCGTPEISISSSGAVTITCATSGASIRYTTDGTDPSASSGTVYSGSFNVSNLAMVKAIAYKDGYDNSGIASEQYLTSGVSGGNVILNDREDHAWSYYSDPDCPIRSLSPADVKITYYGDGIVMTGNADYTSSSTDFIQPGNANYVGGAKVNVGGEDENTFIYYKTLERGDATQTAWTYSTDHSSTASRCPYTTIPNPFQVRPTYGARNVDANNFTGWRGFQCWRLKSVTGGSVYSAANGVTALTTGAVVNAETEIYFAPNSEYGMDVQFEAVWARAYLIKGNQGGANTILSQNVGVERNFMTLTTNESYRFNGTSGRRITNIGYPVTISCYYPSGEAPDNTNGVVTGNNNNITLGADTKFENVTLSAASYTLTTSGYDVIIGRGCTSTNIGTVRGLSANQTNAVDYTIRLESGTYGTFALIDNTARTFSNTVSTRAVFGSDYDRAKSDNGKLGIAANSTVYGGNAVHVFSSASNRNNLTYDWLIKSGRVQASKSVTDANADESIYIGNSGNNDNTQYMGKRRFTMEGGEMASLAGSLNSYGNNRNTYVVNDGDAVEIRIKGGTIRGSVYGAAAYASATGNRRFLFTGGEVRGWIAGGANGTESDGGYLYGSTKIYIGGHTSVNSNSSTSVINRAVGGNVFGAGCGYGASSNSGQVTEGTTVVVADEAYVERGVYGGGSYGYTTSTADVFILGGTVDGKSGGVSGTSYSGTITGGVFGGACQNQGGTVNITMTGGEVHTGIHGGSNATGTISGNVTMQVDGGQVGTSSSNANIHGGGYGTNTAVNGNVSLTLGASTSAADSVTVYGNVYGGSALGDVNDNANDNTTVTMNKALINGNLFGGALGSGADVTGRITVNVNGGRVNGNVFGGGDAAAYSHGGDFPVVNMTGGTVTNIFGGGKGNTAAVTGNPQVTLSGNAHVTGNVYGGGDAARVSGQTNVILRD